MNKPFHNRIEAGQALGEILHHYRGRPDLVVLAISEDAVPIAFEVARELQAPLDVLPVCALALSGCRHAMLGVTAPGGVTLLDDHLVEELDLPNEVIESLTSGSQREINRQERLFRAATPPLSLYGWTVILVGERLDTCLPMRAAVMAVQRQTPARVLVAVPIAPYRACVELVSQVNAIICIETCEALSASNDWRLERSPVAEQKISTMRKQAYAGAWAAEAMAV